MSMADSHTFMRRNDLSADAHHCHTLRYAIILTFTLESWINTAESDSLSVYMDYFEVATTDLVKKRLILGKARATIEGY